MTFYHNKGFVFIEQIIIDFVQNANINESIKHWSILCLMRWRIFTEIISDIFCFQQITTITVQSFLPIAQKSYPRFFRQGVQNLLLIYI